MVSQGCYSEIQLLDRASTLMRSSLSVSLIGYLNCFECPNMIWGQSELNPAQIGHHIEIYLSPCLEETRQRFQCDNLFNQIYRYQGFYDQFCFASSPNNDSAINYYFNFNDDLNKFSKLFIEKAGHLITNAKDKRLRGRWTTWSLQWETHIGRQQNHWCIAQTSNSIREWLGRPLREF